MKRFSLRIPEELHLIFENFCEDEGYSMNQKLNEMIQEEVDPAVFKIHTGFVSQVFKSAGFPKPPELEEQLREFKEKQAADRLLSLSGEEADAVAIRLLRKERSGKILNKKQRNFLNKWLGRQQTQRNNRDVMKRHDVEEKELKAGEETEAFWEEELIEKKRRGEELTEKEREYLETIGKTEEED